MDDTTPTQTHDSTMEELLALSFADAAMRGKLTWISTTMTWFKTEAIFDPFYREIVEQILGLVKEGGPINDKMVLRKIISAQKVWKISLVDVGRILERCVSQGGHIAYYARHVWDAYRGKQAGDELIGFGNQLLDGREVDPVLQEAAKIKDEYLPAPTNMPDDNESEIFQDMIKEAYGEGAKKRMTYTGLNALDRMLGGVPEGALLVVAGGTGDGKTDLLIQCSLNYALNNERPVLFFTLEMSKEEVYDRMASNLGLANVKNDRRMWQGGMGVAENLCLREKKIRLYRGAYSVEQILGVILNTNAIQPVGMVVVDYIQLLTPSRRQVNREEQINEIARGLKQVAMATAVPVFSASQINEAGELRESRAIGHHANIVLKNIPDSKTDHETTLKIIVVKSRSSGTGDVKVKWSKLTHTIRDLDEYDE